MDFDTIAFLENLFGPEVSAVCPAPQVDVVPMGPASLALDPAVPEADVGPDGDLDGGLDELPGDLAPCPACGSLELWQTVAGAWRCQHCDRAALARSRSLAERAERLRKPSHRLIDNAQSIG